MSSKVVVMLLFLLLATACSSNIAMDVVPAVSPTSPATSTSTPTLQAVSTATQEIIVPSPTATPKIVRWGSSSISPDQQWSASIYQSFDSGQHFMHLVVEKQDGSKKWILDKDRAGQRATGDQYPVPFYWSKDLQTLYFTYQGNQDGCFSYMEGGKGLFGLDLATGTVKTILDVFASEMKLSPDESKLAFVDYGDTGLKIFDLQSGSTIELERLYPDLPTGQYGIAWSPDSKQLVFTILLNACIDDRATSIVIVDTVNRSQKIVLREDERRLGSKEWLAEDKVFVSDWSENSWYLNPQTGELIAVGTD